MSDPSAETYGWLGSYVEPTVNPTSFTLAAVRSGSNFNLSWSGAPACLFFNVRAGLNPAEMGVTNAEISNLLTNVVVPSGTNTSVFYWFQVEAVISEQQSIFSNVIQAK